MAEENIYTRAIIPANQEHVGANGRQQTRNNSGGYVYKVNDLIRLERLLCMGTECGTYYTGDEQLNIENAQCIKRLIASGNGAEVLKLVLEYSDKGRTAKQNALMLAMAMCAQQSVDPATKKLCYENLHIVCRIPTHLFMFIYYCSKLCGDTTNSKGWNKAHSRAVCRWYLQFGDNPSGLKRLAMLVTKYKKGYNWTHKDVLRCAHPKYKTINSGMVAIMKYVMNGFTEAKPDLENHTDLLEYLRAVERVKIETNPAVVADLITQHKLVREHVNTELLNVKAVWESLLGHMPMTAMIRNLGKMTTLGMLESGSAHEQTITSRLANKELLRDARIHPFCLLVALFSYKAGKAYQGDRWTPNGAVLKALDSAFYQSFKCVEPTEKKYLLAINVSKSMYTEKVNGCNNVTPATAAAALSLVTARTERLCEVIAFSETLVEVQIGAHMQLPDVETMMKAEQQKTEFIDCSLPMQYALRYRKEFDVIVVYTNHENNAGYIHVMDQLNQYRMQCGIDVKLIMCAMSVNSFSIADPDDADTMHVAGFDSDTPEVMRAFISRGQRVPMMPGA